MPAFEKPHPLYLLLLAASLLFAITAVAYALVPILEEKALEAGEPIPVSPWRTALRQQGWLWLLVELGAMLVLGIASMVADRLRTLKKERAGPKIAPPREDTSP